MVIVTMLFHVEIGRNDEMMHPTVLCNALAKNLETLITLVILYPGHHIYDSGTQGVFIYRYHIVHAHDMAESLNLP